MRSFSKQKRKEMGIEAEDPGGALSPAGGKKRKTEPNVET
jgi:hypothetical protein